MSVFGQVWLYSLAAFFLGVLLTWLVLVRPLRTRVRELERRVVAHRSEVVTAAQGTPPQREGWISDTAEADAAFAELDAVLPTAESPGSATGPEWEAAPERDTASERDAGPEWHSGSGPADEPGAYRSDAAATAEQDSTRVVPGVHGEWFAPADEDDPTAVAAVREDAEQSAPAGISAALDPDENSDSGAESPVPPPGEPSRGLFQPALPNTGPEYEPAAGSEPREPALGDGPTLETPSAGEASAWQPGAGEPGEDDERATTGTLPKRRRREAPAGGFDTPEPIQPSMRPMTRREPTQPGRHSGSLFEPGDTAGALEDTARPGEPAEDASSTEPESAPDAEDGQVGPFGYGSAMPLPGGDRPSEAFTVKASVTTLRYCVPDSASFPEMVAEVWFRTAQDAERVGFRPIG